MASGIISQHREKSEIESSMNEAPYEEIKETVLAALAKDEKDIAFQTLRLSLIHI